MHRTVDMPVHTEDVVELLSKVKSSFNQLQNSLRLSPSTLSRILKFLRKGGFVDVEIVDSVGRGIRKVYALNKKGIKASVIFKQLKDARDAVLKLAGK